MRITIDEAIQLLNDGHVVAVPTETVYGLAASIQKPRAINTIFSLKKRPISNPLILHVANVEQILSYVEDFPDHFFDLAATFWPGPLTIVLKIKSNVIPEVARAGLDTMGFRVPSNEITQQILQSTGPLVMPSANLSGKPSATMAEHVELDFGESFPVVDGGKCERGLESTILYYHEGLWVILRLGSISPDRFRDMLGYTPQVIQKRQGETPLSPGQLFRHYAPKAKLILGDPSRFDECLHLIGFKDRSYSYEKIIFSLGNSNNPQEVAENLYFVLRQLDEENVPVAWVDMDFPKTGLWLSIRERLERAGE